MSDILSIMQKQLDIEVKSAQQKLNTNNLDAIYKLTSCIINMQRINVGMSETKSKETAPEYSNGTFEKNIDLLYERYMNAKKMYRENGGQVYKESLLESVRRLMAELYDMISSMLKDCECAEEKKEIQLNIKKLSDI